MSFLSILGDIGAGIAAPFTGGISLAAIPAIDALGAGASKTASNLASDRGTSAQLTLDAQRQFENELMARQQNQRTAQANALKQSIFASMLQGYQPAQRPMGVPQSAFQGLGATGNQATSFIASDALNRLKAGDQLPSLQPLDVSQYTSPSIWEKILGIGGAAASAYGAASANQKK